MGDHAVLCPVALAMGPARAGRAGGSAGPDQQAGRQTSPGGSWSFQNGTAVARGEAGVGQGRTGGLTHSAGRAGQGVKGAGLGEARAARPPAGRPEVGTAAATLQAVVVVHVAAAAHTVQLPGSELHALYVHFLL